MMYFYQNQITLFVNYIIDASLLAPTPTLTLTADS